MNKEQAIQDFYEQFATAYDENSVPDNARPPYITYSVATSNIDNIVGLTASIWDNSTSWARVTKIKNRIETAIGYGGKLIKLNDGYVWLMLGSPFSQRISGGTDRLDVTKQIYLQIQAEFFTDK